MPEEIVMPRLSDTMSEGTIAHWLKQEGDAVKVGEALMEVETDKATLELNAYHDGTIAKIIVGDGGTAPVGTVVGILAKPGEQVDLSQYEASAGSAPKAAVAPVAPVAAAPAAPAAPEVVPAAPAPSPQEQGAPAAERAPQAMAEEVKASPLARVMAEQAGVDLRTLAGRGSGPHGRIVRQDVEAAVQRGVTAPTTQPSAAPPEPAPAPAPTGLAFEDRELSRIRQAIVRNLAVSKPGAPHIYLTLEVEMDAAMALRKQLNGIVEDEQTRISVNDLVLKATALALRKYPELNAHFLGGQPPKVRNFTPVNLTIAFPGEGGLMVPVLKDVDKKTLGQIAVETKELYNRVRSNKALPDDFSGGTFATSNLGQYGIDEFQAVINPPQAGILAVGAATPRAVVREGEIVVRTTMRATISADHRVADGVYAAQFLQEFKRLLEQPLNLVL
jgi:pyruvate dehydrogenase E2 component (dihydrolipoamide acetyltransferase)